MSFISPSFLKIIKKKNRLFKKIRSISKSITSQLGKQIIVIHISHNISRSKGNQKMKFYQLIEFNMRNIFPET